MRFDAVPKPPTVADRPQDGRGYPVPAITPFEDGQPQFARTDYARSADCAVRRLCSVCGTAMPAGPVWRVVGAGEAEAIGAARAAGRPYRNLQPTWEGPGHRACMLYASMVCPYLGRPQARRRVLDRGTARGATGAVVGFADYEYAVLESQVLFRFVDVVEFLPHDDAATTHLAALETELASRPPKERS
ncbi:hypothetical protein ABH940_000059 [Streptacidiphilus sp. BW17]|uniref:hypothetical protein n=1 Tax=unclassified Streptacidiphilus TaxID=2643834 RepID=UPI00351866FB